MDSCHWLRASDLFGNSRTGPGTNPAPMDTNDARLPESRTRNEGSPRTGPTSTSPAAILGAAIRPMGGTGVPGKRRPKRPRPRHSTLRLETLDHATAAAAASATMVPCSVLSTPCVTVVLSTPANHNYPADRLPGARAAASCTLPSNPVQNHDGRACAHYGLGNPAIQELHRVLPAERHNKQLQDDARTRARMNSRVRLHEYATTEPRMQN